MSSIKPTYHLVRSIMLFWIVSILCLGSSTQAICEYQTRVVGDYPKDASPIWAPEGNEIQGVAHDEDNWYFVSTGYTTVSARTFKDCFLWKVPVTQDLSHSSGSNLHVHLLEFPSLATADSVDGFAHWGDPDFYRRADGAGFVIVPVECTANRELPQHAILIFSSNSLKPIGYAALPGQDNNHIQNYSGWCAVRENGDVVSSSNDASRLFQYSVPWEDLPADSYLGEFAVTWKANIQLKDRSGIPLAGMAILHDMQGGEFTDGDVRLYLVCGRGKCAGQPEDADYYPSDGVHVFETTGWTEVENSVNRLRDVNESGCFNYHYPIGCDGCWGAGAWSPEGLTIWDLTDGRAPNIGGKLHIMAFHYQFFCDNELTFEHFTFPCETNVESPKLVGPSNGEICQPVSGRLSWRTNSTLPVLLKLGTISDLYSGLVVDENVVGSAFSYGPLKPNTTYYWQITVPDPICGRLITSANYSFTTEDPIPPPPTQFQPADFAANQPPSGTFSWVPVSGASSYGIQIKCSNGDMAASGRVTTSEFAYSLPNGDYSWSVVSYNSCSHPGARSTIQHISISSGHQTAIPKHVYPLDGASCIGEFDTLRWDPVPGASGYLVFFKDRCEDGNKGTRTTSNFLPVRLDKGRNYYWRVTEDAPCAPVGPCLQFKTQADPNQLRTRTLLVPIDGARDQSTSLTLFWREPDATKGAGSPERYTVQLWNANGDTTTINVYDTSAVCKDLLEGMTYSWRVAAVDSCGSQSPYSSIWTFTTTVTRGINRVFIEPYQHIIPGDKSHEVLISAENLVEIAGFRLQFLFDPNVLTFRGYTTDGTRCPVLVQPNFHYDSSHGRLDVEAYTSSTRRCGPGVTAGDGPLLKLLFDVATSAPLQPTAITFGSAHEFRDCSGHNISATAYSGFLSVTSPSCCSGMRGNVDCDQSGTLDIVDLTRLIDNLFISLSPLCCDQASDLNLDGVVDIADLTALINFLFIGLDPLPTCDVMQSPAAKSSPDVITFQIVSDSISSTLVISSTAELRGIQLELIGGKSSAPVNQAVLGFQLASSRRGDTLYIGLFDRSGLTTIKPGRNRLFSIPGRFSVARAVASDLNHRSVEMEADAALSVDLPAGFNLAQNYPNPFNPMTTISFSLPSAGDYELRIYNAVGQTVSTFIGRADAGVSTLTWDAREFSSGVYFYRLQTSEFAETKKMILLK